MDRTANTITNFRQRVLDNKGIQQVSRYKCTFVDPSLQPIFCYPESVTLPQRSFVQVPFSYWGPTEQIPIRREYGECAMTFIIYQDWYERRYFERWMDMVIPVTATEQSSVNGIGILQALVPLFTNPFSSEVSANQYSDYSNTRDKQLGTILVSTLDASDNRQETCAVLMQDAYPVSITPTSLSSESTGYGTFVVVFAFKQYKFF